MNRASDSQSRLPAAAAAAEQLDLKNADRIFHEVWAELEGEWGRANMVFPKEIMWLGGAPGAGKGTNTPFIMEARGMTAGPLVMSELLTSPEMERIKDQGRLVGDRETVAILLRELLKPEYASGVVVDGFPRTSVQVECVKLLYQEMLQLRREFFEEPGGDRFRRPIFRITVLYVREQVSIERQMKRGREVVEHNRRVADTGEGTPLPVRATDTSEEHCRRRYEVFKTQTFAALESLRAIFHYHFIDANGSIGSVQRAIEREFQYQSSLELAEDTHDAIRNIPVAGSLATHARQELVRRLDRYRHREAAVFRRVVGLVEERIVPALRRHSLTGRAHVQIADPVFEQEDDAVAMVLDVLSERGYFPAVEIVERFVPSRVDLQTGAITTDVRPVWHFEITFDAPRIRRGHD